MTLSSAIPAYERETRCLIHVLECINLTSKFQDCNDNFFNVIASLGSLFDFPVALSRPLSVVLIKRPQKCVIAANAKLVQRQADAKARLNLEYARPPPKWGKKDNDSTVETKEKKNA